MSHVHDQLLRVLVALQTPLKRLDDRGTGLLEYVLLVSLIALVCLGAVTFFGQATESKMSVPPSMFNSSGS